MTATIPAGTSAAAIRAHYDVDDKFFALWLGREMVYSCALFAEGDDLDAAQTRKLDYHIAQARAAGAPRVLDVGCGWGALLRRLAAGGTRAAVGLTLSRTQARRVEGDAVPGTFVHCRSWQDFEAGEPFDAVISIGAFEHFATRDMTRREKVAAYRRFFEFCHRNLRASRRLSLQTIAYLHPGNPGEPFVPATIFHESELPHPSEILEASEPLFELVALRNDRADYLKTCRTWSRNLAARRAEAVALVGEATTDNYLRYLAIAAAAFKAGAVCLLRMTFARSGSD